jgi:hypothetical protein
MKVQFLTGLRDFFSKAPGLALRLTQSPTQRVYVAPFPRVKRGVKLSILYLADRLTIIIEIL